MYNHKPFILVIFYVACVCAQSRLTLHNLMDCSPPSSSVRGLPQARKLERFNIPFSRGSSWPRDQTCIFRISHISPQIPYLCSTGGSHFCEDGLNAWLAWQSSTFTSFISDDTWISGLMRFGYLIEIGSIWIAYLIKMLFENKTEACYMIVRNTSSFTTKEPFSK